VAQLAVFIPAALAVAASPGADNLLAFRNGLRSGFNRAVLALAGRFTAFLPPSVDTSSNLAAPGVQLAVLGLPYISCEAAMALLWAGSGTLLAARGIKKRTLRRFDQASGGALAAFGGRVDVSDLARR